jgi:hypothetical protein
VEWPNDLSKISPLHRKEHSVADLLKRSWDITQLVRAQREGRADVVGAMSGNQLVLAGAKYGPVHLDLTLKAYQLDKQLPENRKLLAGLVNNEEFPLEARAKILEVMILRGAMPSSGYADASMMAKAFGSDELKERLEYQKAAMNAVLRDEGGLFGQLSRSTDQLPDGVSGRYPATEWMNTMLRPGGLLSDHTSRQEWFQPWLASLDPHERGQAVFHLRDAIEAKEMGSVAKLTGFELSAGNYGFGLQWEGAKDTHWDKVGDGAMGPLDKQLTDNPDQREAFYDGYRLADRQLPDPPPKK